MLYLQVSLICTLPDLFNAYEKDQRSWGQSYLQVVQILKYFCMCKVMQFLELLSQIGAVLNTIKITVPHNQIIIVQ